MEVSSYSKQQGGGGCGRARETKGSEGGILLGEEKGEEKDRGETEERERERAERKSVERERLESVRRKNEGREEIEEAPGGGGRNWKRSLREFKALFF